MKRKHILKQMGVFALSAILGLTPAVQTGASVTEGEAQQYQTWETEEQDAFQDPSGTGETENSRAASEAVQTAEPEETEGAAAKQETEQSDSELKKSGDGTEKETEQAAEPLGENEDTEEAETTQNAENTESAQTGSEDTAESGQVQSETPNSTDSGSEPVQQSESEGYDINEPVIENVQVVQAGQTLTRDDSVEIRVYAYDAESGIESVGVSLGFGDDENILWTTGTGDLTYDPELQCYTYSYSLSDVAGTYGCIQDVTVTDKVGNYTTVYNWDETSVLDPEKCQFWIQQDEITIDSKVVSLDFPQNGEVLTVSDTLEIKLGLDSALEEAYRDRLSVEFLNEETQQSTWFYPWLQEDGTYLGSYSIDNYVDNGKWVLNRIYVEYQGKEFTLQTDAVGELSDYWFQVEGSEEIPENKSPIESVVLDQCGAVLEPGDTVELSVKLADDGRAWEDTATADFVPAVNIAYSKYFSISLNYDSATGMYSGTYTIDEELYPTEWYLQGINLGEINGGFYQYGSDEIADAEYYFFVNNEDTFTTATVSGGVIFQAVDVNGFYYNVETFDVKDVPRRTTYGEAGIKAPDAPAYVPEGAAFLGWVDEDGEPFDESEQFIYDEYRTFYAAYDHKVMTVTYEYYEEGMGSRYDKFTVLAPLDATYGEARALILEQLPDVQDKVPEEMEYLGWTFWEDCPDDEKIPMYENQVSVTADYGKALVNLNYVFLNKEGNGTANVQKTCYVEKGSTFGELKQTIAEQVYPEEGYQDIAFVSWEMPSYMNDEDTISGITYYHIRAVYEKVPVFIQFSYIGEDGNYLHTPVKLYQFDQGSTYGDVLQTIAETDAPGDMYAGLEFKEWSPGPHGDEDETLGTMEWFYPSAEYANALLETSYKYVDANGEVAYDRTAQVVPEGTTVKEAKQLSVDHEAPETYGDLEFRQWEITSSYDDTMQINGRFNLEASADYGDPVVIVTYQYVREQNGIIQNPQKCIQIPEGTTYGKMLEQLTADAPADVYDPNQVQWTYTQEVLSEDEVANLTYIGVQASYENCRNVRIGTSYVGEDGYLHSTQRFRIVEDGTSYEQLKEELAKEALPETFDGITFEGWDIYGGEGVINDPNPELNMTARYDKFVIHYVVDARIQDYEYSWEVPRDVEWDVDHVVLAEEGEELQLPAELEGYEKITWLGFEEGAEDTMTAAGHMTFYGYGTKNGTDPEKPVDPEKPTDPEKPVDPEKPTDPEKPVDPEKPADPEKPVDPEKPADPEKPVDPEKPADPEKPVDPEKPAEPETPNELPDEMVNTVVEEIVSAQPGQTVSVDMQSASATVVSRELLGAAKGKDVNIQLNMGGYSWTINGRDILTSNPTDIDLNVTMDAGTIPSQIIQSMADGNPVRQLSLTHSGNFGFKASLTINMGSENSGKYGNLYYYDSTGKMVFMNAGAIDGSGNVTLSFSHASEYLVVVNDKIMSEDVSFENTDQGTKEPERTEPATSGSSGNDGKTAVTKTEKDVADTADATPVIWIPILFISAAALLMAGTCLGRKRSQNKM